MKILLLILIAYLLGSIQTGLWIGKLFFHTNLREHGSGNTGTTNTFRVLGKTAGTITFLVDMFKGTLAVLLPIWLGVTEVSPLVIGFFAIIGHVFPIFAGFKGGKVLTIMALIIIFRHTENMGRICRHQENLVPFGLNLTKQNPKK